AERDDHLFLGFDEALQRRAEEIDEGVQRGLTTEIGARGRFGRHLPDAELAVVPDEFGARRNGANPPEWRVIANKVPEPQEYGQGGRVILESHALPCQRLEPVRHNDFPRVRVIEERLQAKTIGSCGQPVSLRIPSDGMVHYALDPVQRSALNRSTF